MPEETVRRIVAIISDINMAKTEVSDIHTWFKNRKVYFLYMFTMRKYWYREKFHVPVYCDYKDDEKYDRPILYSGYFRSGRCLEQIRFSLVNMLFSMKYFGFMIITVCIETLFVWCMIYGTLPEKSIFFSGVGHSSLIIYIRISTNRPEALDKSDFILIGI